MLRFALSSSRLAKLPRSRLAPLQAVNCLLRGSETRAFHASGLARSSRKTRFVRGAILVGVATAAVAGWVSHQESKARAQMVKAILAALNDVMPVEDDIGDVKIPNFFERDPSTGKLVLRSIPDSERDLVLAAFIIKMGDLVRPSACLKLYLSAAAGFAQYDVKRYSTPASLDHIARLLISLKICGLCSQLYQVNPDLKLTLISDMFEISRNYVVSAVLSWHQLRSLDAQVALEGDSGGPGFPIPSDTLRAILAMLAHSHALVGEYESAVWLNACALQTAAPLHVFHGPQPLPQYGREIDVGIDFQPVMARATGIGSWSPGCLPLTSEFNEILRACKTPKERWEALCNNDDGPLSPVVVMDDEKIQAYFVEVERQMRLAEGKDVGALDAEEPESGSNLSS